MNFILDKMFSAKKIEDYLLETKKKLKYFHIDTRIELSEIVEKKDIIDTVYSMSKENLTAYSISALLSNRFNESYYENISQSEEDSIEQAIKYHCIINAYYLISYLLYSNKYISMSKLFYRLQSNGHYDFTSKIFPEIFNQKNCVENLINLTYENDSGLNDKEKCINLYKTLSDEKKHPYTSKFLSKGRQIDEEPSGRISLFLSDFNYNLLLFCGKGSKNSKFTRMHFEKKIARIDKINKYNKRDFAKMNKEEIARTFYGSSCTLNVELKINKISFKNNELSELIKHNIIKISKEELVLLGKCDPINVKLNDIKKLEHIDKKLYDKVFSIVRFQIEDIINEEIVKVVSENKKNSLNLKNEVFKLFEYLEMLDDEECGFKSFSKHKGENLLFKVQKELCYNKDLLYTYKKIIEEKYNINTPSEKRLLYDIVKIGVGLENVFSRSYFIDYFFDICFENIDYCSVEHCLNMVKEKLLYLKFVTLSIYENTFLINLIEYFNKNTDLDIALFNTFKLLNNYIDEKYEEMVSCDNFKKIGKLSNMYKKNSNDSIYKMDNNKLEILSGVICEIYNCKDIDERYINEIDSDFYYVNKRLLCNSRNYRESDNHIDKLKFEISKHYVRYMLRIKENKELMNNNIKLSEINKNIRFSINFYKYKEHFELKIRYNKKINNKSIYDILYDVIYFGIKNDLIKTIDNEYDAISEAVVTEYEIAEFISYLDEYKNYNKSINPLEFYIDTLF